MPDDLVHYERDNQAFSSAVTCAGPRSPMIVLSSAPVRLVSHRALVLSALVVQSAVLAALFDVPHAMQAAPEPTTITMIMLPQAPQPANVAPPPSAPAAPREAALPPPPPQPDMPPQQEAVPAVPAVPVQTATADVPEPMPVLAPHIDPAPQPSPDIEPKPPVQPSPPPVVVSADDIPLPPPPPVNADLPNIVARQPPHHAPPRPAPAARAAAPLGTAPIVTAAAAVLPMQRVAPVVTQADHAAEDSLRGRIRDAVQAAAHCPAAARIMRLSGKVGVAFDYRDGALMGDVQVAHSSGTPMLDSVAAGAVLKAHYPAAPLEEAQHVLHLLVWVDEACDR